MLQNQTNRTKSYPRKLPILFAGGGSGGPVAPLLAVAGELNDFAASGKVTLKALFLGTGYGPERAMVERAGWEFKAISAGKLRRYFSLKSLFAPFLVVIGFFQALRIIKRFRPFCAVGSGSFVQVPALWAAWVLRVPIVIHQQDAASSMANSLCAPIAKRITVTFEHSLQDFHQGLGLYRERISPKTVLTGNPCRSEIFDGNRAAGQEAFQLDPSWPTVLVLGGGTGAAPINQLIVSALPQLTRKVQIIHVTGRGKGLAAKQEAGASRWPRYHQYEFLDNIGQAYAVSDIIISRAGLSTITELSNLERVSIIIPMPDTHQEDNAWLLWQNRAAIVLDQREITPGHLVKVITRLLFDLSVQKILKENMRALMPRQSAAKIANEILKVISKYHEWKS